MAEALLIGVFALAGVITQRVIGFGIAAFLAPLMLIFYHPSVAVLITLLVGTLSCLIILYNYRHRRVLIWPVVLRLSVAAIPGLILGAYIVTRIDKGLLQILVGAVVIAGVLIQEYAFPKPSRALGVTRGINLSGFLSGVFNACAANGAASMVVWMRFHKVTADQVRQNFAMVFILINFCSMSSIYYFRPETFSRPAATVFLLLVPIVFLGNWAGNYLSKKVNAKQYEKLVFVAVILTGLVSAGLGVASFT